MMIMAGGFYPCCRRWTLVRKLIKLGNVLHLSPTLNILNYKFCAHKVTGGITKFKEHLVGTHKGIRVCPNVPHNVKDECVAALKALKESKIFKERAEREIG